MRDSNLLDSLIRVTTIKTGLMCPNVRPSLAMSGWMALDDVCDLPVQTKN
jgi:hypothetical protein